jgi:hypothetical protein
MDGIPQLLVLFRPIRAWIDPNHYISDLSGLLSTSDLLSISLEYLYDALLYLVTWGPDLA